MKCLSFFSFQGAVGVVSLIRFLLCPLQSIHLLSLTAVRVGLLFKLLTLSSDRHLLSRSVPLGHNRRSLVPPRGSQGSQRFPYSFSWPPLLFSKMGPPLLSKMGPPLLSKMEAAIAIQDGGRHCYPRWGRHCYPRWGRHCYPRWGRHCYPRWRRHCSPLSIFSIIFSSPRRKKT